MDQFKPLCLLWTILSAACVSCQELKSTLREGNRACSGEEVIFTCTVRAPSTVPILVLAWSSDEYIGQGGSLQFSTANMIGEVENSDMDGSITATATVTNNTNVDGELVLESTLRITAVEASMVICMRGTDGGSESIELSISAVPGVPQGISAAEISRPRDNLCIILVQWNPPANSNGSDIDQYIISVSSRNIRKVSSSTLTTLTVMNCGDDIRIQIAAVNRVGCAGMNSSEVPLTLLDIPTGPGPTEVGSGTTITEDGSATTSSVGGAVGITIAVILGSIGIAACVMITYMYLRRKGRKEPRTVELNYTDAEEDRMDMMNLNLQLRKELKELRGSNPKDCLIDLYIALRTLSQRNSENATPAEETSDSVITSATGALRAVLKKAEAVGIKDGLKNALEGLKEEKDDDLQRALDYLIEIIPDISRVDDDFKNDIERLRDKAKTSFKKDALDSLIEKVDCTAPDEIQSILLRLCDALFENLLKLSPQQEAVVRMFEISLESLKEVKRLLSAEFTKGLEREGEDVKVKMFVTHIHEMPKGTEEGEFLVMDLRVNHLRVLHINIVKGSIKKKDCKEFYMDETTKNSENLLDFIVNCIAKFIKDRNIKKELPIGFTFPFPVNHESLTCGKLIRWTKDFEGTGSRARGKDVVELLKEAVSKREEDVEVNINVVALINNTTGILLSVGNEVPDCHIGLNLGDGANACYMEEVCAISKFKGDGGHTKVIVNTEWCAFGDDGKLDRWRNEYDRDLDDKSSNPKQQLFEKMISDKYQGVIVCLILKDLISKGELFGGQSSKRFKDLKELSTQKLSTMEGWDMEKCKELFKNRFGIEASIKDCEVIRRVCVAVSTRAARLAAAGIVALVKKINKMDGCTVAVDGSLYKREPFPERLRDTLDELAPRNDIKMKLTEDGSSIGAAFAAAMNYDSSESPLSSTPRSPLSLQARESVGLEGPQELNIGDQGHHHPLQARTDNIELSEIET